MLLTRSPLEYPRRSLSARLACVKHAASVRPEPGSNSPSKPKTFRTQRTNPSQKTTTSNRQNHRSSTQKETTTTTKPTPPQKQSQPSHGDGIIQTNSSTNTLLSSQKSDAHLMTSLEASRGQPEKTYRSCDAGVKSDRVRLRAAPPALPKTGGHLRGATPEDYLVPGRACTRGWVRRRVRGPPGGSGRTTARAPWRSPARPAPAGRRYRPPRRSRRPTQQLRGGRRRCAAHRPRPR